MTDDVAIGRVSAEEFADFRRLFAQIFGYSLSEEELAEVRPWIELDRAVAARSDGQIVGTSGAYTFQISLPHAGSIGCSGVTVVSVRADHRRRGVLTRMMRQLFDDAAERGEPYAALWASEAPIYGRFGFGPAAPTVKLEVPRAATLRTAVDVSGVRLVDADTAKTAFPTIYDTVQRARPGMLAIGDSWWDRLLDDPPGSREGGGEKRFALLDDRAFAIYRFKSDWVDGVPNGTVQVFELHALDAEAHATMWRFLLDTDLAGKVVATRWDPADPLPLLLDNEGLAKRRIDWPLMVALVDLPAALAARGYAADDTLVLRVHDPFQPGNDGTWRLEVVDGRGSCEPAKGDADLELSADVLAALCLGGQRATHYLAAGRVQQHTPGTAVRFDRLFASDVAPWHHVMF